MQLRNIKNRQKKPVFIYSILAVSFLILTIVPFLKGNPLSEFWALAFISFFLSFSSVIIAMIFKKRAKKMDKLLSGEKLLVHLELTKKLLQQYAETMREESKHKNKAIMWVIGVLFLLITIPFLFFIEKEEISGFLFIIGAIVLLVFFASRFFPRYYYHKNINGDRQILLGEKYAYFNGYFHNWDFPISGLTTAKTIKKPFRGIHLAYYYTDYTWRHVHEIKIPIQDDFNPEPVLSKMRLANGK